MRFRITTLDGGQGVAIREVDALDEADAHRQAIARGLRVLAIQAARLKGWRRARLSLVAFSNELVALLEAGLSLVEAIDALTEKERDESIRHLLEGLRRRLYEGQSLSVALGEFPSSFPALYVATVRAASRAAGSLVLLFLVAYVVPRFSGIYEDIGGELPFASKMLMQWGRLLEAHGLAVLAGALACVALAGYGVLRPGFRAAVGRVFARIPTVGYRIELYQLARLYRTVGMLLRGGLPVVTAFEMTRGLMVAAARPRLAAATRSVREGRSLTDALAAQGLTTPVAERMLRVGERSGNMGEMMERIAAFYDEELSRFVELATRLIEPAMMTVIGLVIGVIVVLMYFPIFELAGSIR